MAYNVVEIEMMYFKTKDLNERKETSPNLIRGNGLLIILGLLHNEIGDSKTIFRFPFLSFQFIKFYLDNIRQSRKYTVKQRHKMEIQ